METITHSILLKNIGHALLTNFWQAAIALLIVSVLFSIGQLRPLIKYRMAQATNILLFALFVFALFKNTDEASTGVQSATGLFTAWFYTINDAVNTVLPFIASVYLVFLAAQLIVFTYTCFFTRNLAKQGLQRVPAEWKIFAEEVAAILSVKRKVKIFLSEKVSTPLTIGFIKPVILIPVACINQLTVVQMEAVILHELAHIKRADYLLNVLNSVISRLLFFSPFIKKFNTIIDEEREKACDDLVMQFRYKPEEYAGSLLALAKVQCACNSFALKASAGDNDILMHRIKRILNLDSGNTYQSSLIKNLMISAVMICLAFINTSKIINVEKPIANIAVKPMPVNNFSNEKNYFTLHAQQSFLQKENAFEVKHIENIVAEETEKRFKKIITPVIKKETKTCKSIEIANDEEPVAAEDVLRVPQSYIQNVSGNKIVLTPELYQQILSYYNFKKMQNTIAEVQSDSITVKERDETKGSYRKVITIEATDSKGETRSFDITIEVYQ